MRKYQFLLLLAAFGVGFFIMQLLMYKGIDQNKNLDSNQDVIESFLLLCKQHGTVAIVMDPEVIQKYLDGKLLDDVIFCEGCLNNGRPVTTFAIPDSQGFTEELLKSELRFFEVKVTDPHIKSRQNLQEMSESYKFKKVTSHYFLQSKIPNTPLVHVVVLYEWTDENKSYLWHSPIRWHDTNLPRWVRQSIRLEDLHYGAYAGIFSNLRFAAEFVLNKKFQIKIPENLLPQLTDSRFIECNHSRAQVFYRRYGNKNRQNDEEKFLTDAKTVMLKGREILEKLDVRFWLSSGNCLGWFRQCGIIPYSQDVDFGIWIRDHDHRIIPAFQGGGFTLKNIFGKITDSYELSFYHVKTGVKLDLFFFYEESDHMWNGGTEYNTGNKYKYIFPKFSLCWTELLDMKFRVPCETESYVKANYGDNWMEPVTSWDWKESPPNVRPNGAWSDEEWDDVIQVFDNVQFDDIGLNFKEKGN